MSDALEIKIEEAWVALTKMPPKRRRTLYLTRNRNIVWGDNGTRNSHLQEIGTYNRTVTLEDFRGDVFWASERVRDAAA